MKAATPKKKSPATAEVKENTFPVVAIGASAGGLEAMMELLKYLPADTGMAFIYVQHLSPDHKSMLTEILTNKTSMIVQEIDDMDKIQPDNVFVIPYNKGIEVTDGHIKLIPRSETSAAITIDILFSTLAEAQKERVIGIVLSGSASDGTLGMKTIKQHGGLTFAQDDTAKFTSMPHSAIAAGAVDFILSPKEIALELGRLSKHPLIKTVGVKNGEEDLIENSNPDLKIILNQLHKATGVDFSAYKMSTIKRRIIRRMLLYKITLLKEYAKLLLQKKEEIHILYQDLLINVTSFFRDTETHKYLKESLFPKLLVRKKTGQALRFWVPACATGEEAYSIAMMLLEIQESKTTNIPVQIFATDLSEQAITKARIGIYTKQDLETVSPKRIQRFFTKADGGFRVNKALRDMCVFAPHNILHDPPFSRLDFISCCNLFIYLDTAAQKKAINTFHYALNEDGFLMLGKSENISQSANLFTGFNKKYKIFSRKINSGTRTLPPLLPRYAQQTFTENNILKTNKNNTNQNISANYNGLDSAIDAVLVSEFMPASVVINHQMEIVQFRGITDLFLTHPKGKATFNILKMARPEIAFELRNAISKVIKTKQRIRKGGIELKINSIVKIISLEIVPLKIESNEPLLLVLFTEQEQTENFSLQAEGGKNNSVAKDRRIKKLELELAAAHADALFIAQEQEAFAEELQSANEEVVSSNEELQTVNEELETSKEEIESANEELTTTNQELQTRNDLLNEAYDYSEALFATIHEPMIVLDKNVRVKFANKAFYKTFHVKEEDTEGKLLYDLGNKQWNIPLLRELIEDILPGNTHFHHFEITHTFPFIGEKTMLLNASRIIQKINHEEIILLAYADVTEARAKAMELKNKENEILLLKINEEEKLRKVSEESEKKYRTLLTSIDQGFTLCEIIRNKEGKAIDFYMLEVNATYEEQTGVSKEAVLGKRIIQTFPSLTKWMETYAAVVDNQCPAVNESYFEDTDRWFENKAYPVGNDKFAVLFRDISEQKQASQYVRSLIEASLDPLVTVSVDGKITDVNEASIKVTGIEREKLIDTDFSHYFTEPQKAQEGYQQVFEKGFVADYPLTIKHKNGKLTDVLYNASVYKDDKGNVLGVFAAAREVTEQKQASQYARSLIEASLDPLVTISADGKITDVNEASIKVTGIEREKLIDTDFSDYFTEPQKAQEGYQQVFEKGFVADYPLTIKHKNGNLTDVLYNASVYKDDKGNVLGVFAAARDVTERKMFEKELINAKEFAENATKSKQQFLSNMSHEIRTPMNAILGFTNVLLKSKVDHAQEEYLMAIKVSGDALLVLINDILDLAKVDAGKMTFEQTPFNLATSLSAMLQLFDIKMKEKNLELVEQFDATIPEIILGDPMRLRQIILNLLSNAAKFTNAGKITMHVALLNQDAEKVTIEFTVTDTGIGIHKNKLEHIFDDFEQATYENSRLYGGTGLGLSIVRKLIERQGGTIHVESELGKGSTFSFQLPFAKTNQKIVDETERLSNKPAEIKNIRVLVAEDLTLNQLLIKLILADFGFEVDIADNGKIAIEKLQKNTYDLVLMDLQMPEMNGFDATAYVRNTMNSNIPIIALTADVTSIDVEKARAVGMDDYISKPVDEQLLYSKIIKVLQKTD